MSNKPTAAPDPTPTLKELEEAEEKELGRENVRKPIGELLGEELEHGHGADPASITGLALPADPVDK